MEIVVIGTTAFLPGFALAGIHTTVLANADTMMQKVREHEDAGIIVLDETLTTKLDLQEKITLETSIKPVIILLSTDDTQQTVRLKKAIINTLGVDLLK